MGNIKEKKVGVAGFEPIYTKNYKPNVIP